jgi:hypothetical protein
LKAEQTTSPGQSGRKQDNRSSLLGPKGELEGSAQKVQLRAPQRAAASAAAGLWQNGNVLVIFSESTRSRLDVLVANGKIANVWG